MSQNTEINISKISMPLACISCDNYQHTGRQNDEHTPFVKWGEKQRTHFGQCKKHNVKVFGTQLCTKHEYPIEVMEVHPVQNRKVPLEPFQETLI